jgi:hypothetical protein
MVDKRRRVDQRLRVRVRIAKGEFLHLTRQINRRVEHGCDLFETQERRDFISAFGSFCCGLPPLADVFTFGHCRRERLSRAIT